MGSWDPIVSLGVVSDEQVYLFFISETKARHECAGYASQIPSGFLESRTATCSLADATSTHSPLPMLRSALRQLRDRASILLTGVNVPPFPTSKIRILGSPAPPTRVGRKALMPKSLSLRPRLSGDARSTPTIPTADH
jgi:hypothetical protein